MRAMYAYLNLRNTPTAPSNIIPIVNTGDVSSQRSIRHSEAEEQHEGEDRLHPLHDRIVGFHSFGGGEAFHRVTGFHSLAGEACETKHKLTRTRARRNYVSRQTPNCLRRVVHRCSVNPVRPQTVRGSGQWMPLVRRRTLGWKTVNSTIARAPIPNGR